MGSYFQHQKLLVFRLGLLLFFFSLTRLLFYFFNNQNFELDSIGASAWLFFVGLRFDLSAIFYLNFLYILMHIIPGAFKGSGWYQQMGRIYFVIINGIALGANFVDVKFFDFEHKRLTADMFSSVWLGEDFSNLLPQFLSDYWYLFILWGVVVAGLWFLYPKFRVKIGVGGESITTKAVILQIVCAVVILGLGVVAGRGGFQMKPLRIITATTYTSAQNSALVLNSPFTILKTLKKKEISGKKYYSSSKEIVEHFSNVVVPDTAIVGRWKKPNVVVIILESFSSEYTGFFGGHRSYTPFLDSLAGVSWSFKNAYANGKRSIEAVPSILASLPALTDDAFITTRYGSNQINSLPSLLSENGYTTSFFHGGHNGTMGFDSFAGAAGIQNYYGRNEYVGPPAEDGGWGIYDEEFLQFFAGKLTTFKQPFFSAVFTLSSHHPYTVPVRYAERFKEGKLPILKTIQYADYALLQFFKEAQNHSWYKNTLFILTADHTAQPMGRYFGNKVGNYDVPLIFFYPGDPSFRGVSNEVAQQSDIMPTVLDLVGYKEPYIAYGNSVFHPKSTRFAVNYMSGIYQLIQGDFCLQFNGDKAIALFNYKKDSLLIKNILLTEVDSAAVMERKLKAIIQGYEEALESNTLYIK